MTNEPTETAFALPRVRFRSFGPAPNDANGADEDNLYASPQG